MTFDQLHRREFITLLGGAAVAWPLAASAQQAERVRRIGVLMSIENDSDGKAQLSGFTQGLAEIVGPTVATTVLDMDSRGGDRRYGCRALLLSSQRRLLMWQQTDKSPFREVTINYFKWS